MRDHEPVDAAAADDTWPEPDLSVLRPDQVAAPEFPLSVFGQAWGEWIATAAEAAACPPDYVAAPLLAAASALIGNARWAQATPGWAEPPHLWLGVVGDSGNGKSPGADCLMRDVLPEIERRMLADFPDRLREWQFTAELARAARERWQRDLRAADRAGAPAPFAPILCDGPEPQAPRLRQHDVTIEKVAELLGTAAPKGLLIVRDELAGWIAGLNAYHAGGRAFWLEAYGGRPYRVERKSDTNPIVIPRLAVSVYGGTQPDKLARLRQDGDDGLLARLLWLWPEPLPFRLGAAAPGVAWAIRALDRLRELDLQASDPRRPLPVLLTLQARGQLEVFGQEMQHRQRCASGLMRAAYGKARGQALRLALVLEMLWWCGETGASAPPTGVGGEAFRAAARLLDRYFLPMAERVYGKDALITEERNAVTLARWVLRTRPIELHVRHLQREIRLPGLRTAGEIHRAAEVLVKSGWLRRPTGQRQFGPRPSITYSINPWLRTAANCRP